MKQKISSYILLIAFLAALIPAAMPAYSVSAQEETTTVDIQPGEGSMKDAQIVSSAENTNYGTSTE